MLRKLFGRTREENPPMIPPEEDGMSEQDCKPIESIVHEEVVEIVNKESNGRIFNRVKVQESFSDPNYSAQKIWRYFSSDGNIGKIGSSSSYDGKIIGVPTLNRDDQDNLYPTHAVFEVKIEGHKYRVEFDSSRIREELEVIVECDFGNVDRVNELLLSARVPKMDKPKLLSIKREYPDKDALDRVYLKVNQEASSASLKGSGNYSKEYPQMEINDEGELVPLEADLEAVLNEQEYVFSFRMGYGNAYVEVVCPPDKAETMSELLESTIMEETEEGIKVKTLDFSVPVGRYSWEDVGGLEGAKNELESYIQWPLDNADLLEAMDTSVPSGVLLIGPPGNGKSTIAKILANESGACFYTVSPKDINSMWVGGTEKNWGRLFKQARKDVQSGKRVIIFIDEVDGFFTDRNEMSKYARISFAQFCQEWEGISEMTNVMVLGATNRYEDLDSALIRPGRFTKKIYIDNPNEKGRHEVFEIYTGKKALAKDVNLHYLVEKTEGYSAVHVKDVCDTAAFNAIRRYSTETNTPIKDIRGDLIKQIIIGKSDFEQAIGQVGKYIKRERDKVGFHLD